MLTPVFFRKCWACLFLWGIAFLSLQLNAQNLTYDLALAPFYHGVASGDPLADRVIIWTRITPEGESSDQEIEVSWKMATDPEFTDIVQNGQLMTNAARDYTVKVDVTGLASYTTYYYQFEAMGKASIIGRTRTTPTGSADHLRFAVVSCSNYQAGYFSAYGRIADRADLDAVIHLGDYIYEYSATGEDFYGDAGLRDSGERRHLPDKEIVTLADYRTRYSQYRLDPDLRRAHQQHPFITNWDDHESANDAYEDGAENHQPDEEGSWDERKSVSRQVYTEWMPIRGDLNEIPLYRTIQYGELMDLIMLDTRLEERDIQGMSITNAELYSSDRTMLGDTQKQWMFDQLQNSTAKWKVIGNQVIFSPFNVWWAGLDPNGGFTPDGIESVFLDIWDGYPTERDEIINFISGNSLDNVVVLTGDFHSTFAYDVTSQPSPLSGNDPTIAAAGQAPVPVTPTYNPTTRQGSVAVEFATPSVNSANFDENVGAEGAAGFEFQINKPLAAPGSPLDGINPNPHMLYNDLDQHGYFILDVKEERAQANWYFVETILEPNSPEQFASAWGSDADNNYLTEGEESAAKADAPPLAPDAMSSENFTLQILHASDLEGGVEAIDNAPNFAAIVDRLEEEENTLVLSGGDNYIPGPFFGAAGDGSLRPVFQEIYQELYNEAGLTNIRETPGRLDITIMNIIGFDASAVGNHEFDAGTNAFSDIVGTDIRGTTLGDVRWLGAQFPYLSANLDFSGDGDLGGLFTSEIQPTSTFISAPDDLDAAAAAPKFAPATTVEFNGETVGIVGATTQIVQSISSAGGVEVLGPTENDMPALAQVLQPTIDALASQGINKIVLVTHLQQIALEKELIGLLSGVDVVIAGGSDVLFAQEDDVLRSGDEIEEAYPFITQNADGDPAVVVGTDGEYSYVGRLLIEFTSEGVLVESSLDNEMSGAYATVEEVVSGLWETEDPFAEGTKGELVQRLTNSVETIVNEQDGVIVGKTSVYLDGRRAQVRTEETNLGNLTADASLATAQQFDASVKVSLRNGGGIRAAIGEVVDLGGGNVRFAPPQANPESGKQEGDISQLDIVNTLRFNNSLSLLTLSAADLLAVLEYAVSASEPDATPGQFPQVAGVRFSFDITQDVGNRVQTVEIIDQEGNVEDTIAENGEVVGDAEREIRVVTLDFLAGGGDGYPYSELGENRVDLPEVLDSLTDAGQATFTDPGTEQDALAEYLLANFSDEPFAQEETPVDQDTRILNLNADGGNGGQTIVEIAQGDERFGLLVEAVVKAGLAETLSSEGSFTVFAPTNTAFENALPALGFQSLDEVPVDVLTQILLYHVLPTELFAADLVVGEQYETAQGLSVAIGQDDTESLTVNGVNIILPDVDASNGVIHAIDEVLVPVANVTKFVLVNARTNHDIREIVDGDVLDLTQLPHQLNVRAEVAGHPESVQFTLNGEMIQPQNAAPYALFGDDEGDYQSGKFELGSYVLSAIPYSGRTATGIPGTLLEISFEVVERSTIAEIVRTNDDFSMLATALRQVGYLSTVRGEGPFTVFAPNNAAFESLLTDMGLTDVRQIPIPVLREVIRYHIVIGEELRAADLSDGQEIETRQYSPVTISIVDGTVKVNDATVIAPDVLASNGVAHVIDQVLMPPTEAMNTSGMYLEASPNPGASEVNLQVIDHPEARVEVAIMDQYGTPLSTLSFNTPPDNEVNFSLDISSLPTGVYMIQAQLGEDRQVLRVIR